MIRFKFKKIRFKSKKSDLNKKNPIFLFFQKDRDFYQPWYYDHW